LTLIAVKV